MENNELYQILEAVVLRDSLSLYMGKLREQHRNHPDFETTMQFCGQIYKKYSRIAGQRVTTDAMGRVIIRPDIRRNIDLN